MWEDVKGWECGSVGVCEGVWEDVKGWECG